MNKRLSRKLTELPLSPGVYLYKSSKKEVIYVGKASVLKNRVRQYFQNSRSLDNKTIALVAEIDDVDWLETESEIDALFLESELIKRYKPRYNILLRDDKSQTFVRVDMKSEWPVVKFTRNPLDDGAEYIGPFYNGSALKKALKYLRRIFPYLTKPFDKTQSKLAEDIGISPKFIDGPEVYKKDLRNLISYIRGNRRSLVKQMDREMKVAAREQRFEDATLYRNRLKNLGELSRRVTFGDQEFLSISKDEAMIDLVELFGLSDVPRRIEGFDISHMSGTNVVASMVVFQNGVSSRSDYRKFKTRKEQNNDFDNMYEIIFRRFSEERLKSWGVPDVVLIDGGIGQLESALRARDDRGSKMTFIGLAEKREQIVINKNKSNVCVDRDIVKRLNGFIDESGDHLIIDIPNSTHLIKLLQRIRDESHRFAVSYHTALKRKHSTISLLEQVPGVGPRTRARLIKEFGSLKSIQLASLEQLSEVVGPKRAGELKKHLSV